MTFPKRYAVPVTDGITTFPAVVANGWNVDISNAVDGGSGGVYAPMAELDIGGLGLGRTLPFTGSGSGLGWDTFNNDTAIDGTAHSRSVIRSRSLAHGAVFVAGTNWTIITKLTLRHVLQGGGLAGLATIPLNDTLVNGEVLTSVVVSFGINLGHSALPAFQPSFSIIRNGFDGTNSVLGGVTLAAPNVSAYENGGALQTVTIGLTTTIDKANNEYVLSIADEQGSFAQAGNTYWICQLGGHITSHQPF